MSLLSSEQSMLDFDSLRSAFKALLSEGPLLFKSDGKGEVQLEYSADETDQGNHLNLQGLQKCSEAKFSKYEETKQAETQKNIEKSHDAIKKMSIEATESTTQALLQRFRHNKQTSTEQLEADAKIDEVLYLPPSEEGIEYARRDGSQSSKTTLGAQMRRFEKIVAKEEKELESLWKQWASVQEELAQTAEEALGPEWATILPVFSADDQQMIDDGNDKAFEKNVERLEILIKTTGEQAIEKMVASEKDFKIRQDDQNRKLLKLFRDEDEDGED
ncbi:MAG: hypothetical protein Q9195_000549 [Heterodermia aff. obscurata]